MLNKEYELQFFFGNDDMNEMINYLAEGEFDEDGLMQLLADNFKQEWSNLQREHGHLYGLWNDCIAPQISAVLGFKRNDVIDEERHKLYMTPLTSNNLH